MSDNTDAGRLSRLESENGLLKTEIRVLRTQLDDLRESLEHSEWGSESRAAEELEELEQARGDIRWVTRRISKTPLAWVLRKRQGYRNLEQRWLD